MTAKDKQKLGQSKTKLPCQLSDVELLKVAKRIGQVHDELHHHLVGATATKKALKDAEDALDGERTKLAHVLFTGCEPREVVVEAWADFVNGQFLEVRKDTGAVITKRKLLVEEKQGRFEFGAWENSLFERTAEGGQQPLPVEVTEDAA